MPSFLDGRTILLVLQMKMMQDCGLRKYNVILLCDQVYVLHAVMPGLEY